MKNIIYLSGLLIVFCFSCKEGENDLESQDCTDNCVTISGYLTTLDSTKALENIDLDIRYKEPDGFGDFSINRIKAQTSTDKNGYYSMTFGLKDDETDTTAVSNLELNVYLNDEFFFEEYTHTFQAESGDDLIWNYYFPYKSTLRIFNSGIENMQQNERVLLTIEIYKYSYYLDFYYTYSSGYYWDVPAHQDMVIKTTVYKNDIEYSSRTDSAYIEKNDTLDYDIYYE